MTANHPSPSPVHPRDALHALLGSLFPGDGQDLRRFVRGDRARETVIDTVSWTSGLDAIIHDFIERCEARGLVDEGLFRRLCSVRPHRRPEIVAVAQAWGYSLPPEPIADPGSRRKPTALVLGSLGLVGLVGLGIVVLPYWTERAEQHAPTAEPLKEAPLALATEPFPPAPLTPATEPLPPAPDPPVPNPPEPDESPLTPAARSTEHKAPASAPPAKATSPRRCPPASKPELLAHLKQAGQKGGALHPCWIEFWGQSAIRTRECPVHLHGDSARRATLTFTNPKQRIAATACLASKASATFQAMPECSAAVDYTFMLAEIEPS